jgi:hypothetical protein
VDEKETEGDGYSDDLSAVWDEMQGTSGASETAESAPEPVENEAEQAGRLRDSLGRFARKLDEAFPEESTEESASVTTAPEHWSQADREAFDALPEEMKPLYLEKAKLLESGFNKKFEDIANERKTYESLKEVFGPGEMQQLAEANVSLPQYVGRLVSVAKQLQANPHATINWLAQQCGVDLGAPGPQSDEVATLRQQAAMQMQENFDREWFAFASEHNVPDSLRQPMGLHLMLNPQMPHETTRQALERAHEHAKWTDPEIRQSILEAEIQARTAEAQRKADLAKARNAGRVVKSKTVPGMNSHEPGETWRSELERQWDLVNA